MRPVDRGSPWWEYADLKWQQHKERIRIEFELDRYTRNTGKFAEVEAHIADETGQAALEPAVRIIYVQKWVLDLLGRPTTLFVEISGAPVDSTS